MQQSLRKQQKQMNQSLILQPICSSLKEWEHQLWKNTHQVQYWGFDWRKVILMAPDFMYLGKLVLMFIVLLTLKSSVHPEVAEILRNSRGRLVDGKWIKPLYNARKLAKLRNEYIAKGYYWPQKPMADRGLDRTPKGHKRVMLQEER